MLCAERPAEGAKSKLPGQPADQIVLRGFHAHTGLGSPIIVAEQMQHPMNDIAHQFTLPGGAETAGLAHRFIHANEDFPVQEGGLSRALAAAGSA